MKKSFAYVMIAAMLCLALCGCGNQNSGRDDMAVGTPAVPEMTPLITPMPTPDVEDGIVEDRDGMIEDKDTGHENKTGKDKSSDRTAVSPSPKVTSEP